MRFLKESPETFEDYTTFQGMIGDSCMILCAVGWFYETDEGEREQRNNERVCKTRDVINNHRKALTD
jgi:hypothetical protein